MDDAISTRSETLFDEKPSLAVIDRIAELEGEEPAELSPPLYASIDPQALDSLVRSSNTGESRTVETVQFTYLEYDVCVRSDGEVIVSESARADCR